MVDKTSKLWVIKAFLTTLKRDTSPLTTSEPTSWMITLEIPVFLDTIIREQLVLDTITEQLVSELEMIFMMLTLTKREVFSTRSIDRESYEDNFLLSKFYFSFIYSSFYIDL
jgi:hypothetical protein